MITYPQQNMDVTPLKHWLVSLFHLSAVAKQHRSRYNNGVRTEVLDDPFRRLFLIHYIEDMQPAFGKFLPVALMIGVAAALTVWLSLSVVGPMWSPLNAVWALFISWALYFAGGAKLARAHKYAIGLIGGVVLGWVTLYLAGIFQGIVGATWNLPLGVFFVATTIVLLELTDWFEYAPAYFFGYAGYFAYVFNAGLIGSVPYNSFSHVINFSVLMLIGLVIGYVTYALREMILEGEGVPADQQQTVFDKEGR